MNLFEMPLHFVPGCFNVADHTFREFCIFRHQSPQTWNHYFDEVILISSFFFWRNFEVKQIFCHYCEPHDLYVSDWPNVVFLCKLWNSMDKLLEIGAAKNGFHENDVEHWLWIEIWSRMSNNNIRFRNHLLMDMALPLLEFFVLLQKRRNPNDISRETILCATIFVKKTKPLFDS